MKFVWVAASFEMIYRSREQPEKVIVRSEDFLDVFDLVERRAGRIPDHKAYATGAVFFAFHLPENKAADLIRTLYEMSPSFVERLANDRWMTQEEFETLCRHLAMSLVPPKTARTNTPERRRATA